MPLAERALQGPRHREASGRAAGCVPGVQETDRGGDQYAPLLVLPSRGLGVDRQVLDAPYAPVHLPRLLAADLGTEVDRQFSRGRDVLTQVLGLAYEEAATVCDCPIGTIRSRVARARADLVALLADDAEAGAAAS